ncbi:MAG: penicillin-binding transpeptidase domain-containing protein [Chloroflexi bacterium]|nr:penicillin-binding transpeptidase domain-containing protein [Chloroflexota bacterium]
MYELQVIRHDEFEAVADENRFSQLPIAARRGAIFDRNDQRLAFNVPAYNVTIIPAQLPADTETELDVYNRLSALVGVPPTREIAEQSGQFARSIQDLVEEVEGIEPFRPVIIARDVPQLTAMQILEERIYMPGVDVAPAAVREYPTGALTTHIIGYMGPIPAEEADALEALGYNPAFDRIGYEGIERYLEARLAGQRGSILREVDVAGEVIKVVAQVDPAPGQNVRLTIDTDLQAFARQALIDQLEELNRTAGRSVSQQGVVIAMDPRTGEVLALVSYPSYDNSRFARAIDVEYFLEIVADPLFPLLDKTIKGQYPPGSVWKVITAAAVLEEKVIDPDTLLLDEGQLLVENRYAPLDRAAAQRFVCWLRSGHGRVDMIRGISWSCDVYFYQIGGGNPNLSSQTIRPGGLGIDDLFRYGTAFGIGSELGIELPFENPNRMPDPDWKRRNQGESWSTGDTYNAAFGQGYVNVTPLQLISSVAATINGGLLYQPTIIREFLDEERQVIEGFQPKVLRTINREMMNPGDELTLLLLEDMLMKGESSLACVCEPNSAWYDPFRCDPEGYRNTVDLNPDPGIEDLQTYRIHIPLNYSFNGSVCQQVRFRTVNTPYIPPFVTASALDLVREGMREAVIGEGGTAQPAALPFVEVAGKTGTAEYCDDNAWALNLCVPGQWPAHAWYTGYAPYNDPEVIILAFVYNGGEGSQVALPIVRRTMEEYYRLKVERDRSPLSAAAAASEA